MARGLDKHRARLDAVQQLGRSLARRARSTCELCGERGVRLDPVEVEPLPDEPDLEHAVMICERCQGGLSGGALDAVSWRFLETAVWAELPVVQVVAVRLLDRLVEDGVPWAAQTRDTLYLEPDVEAWIGQS